MSVTCANTMKAFSRLLPHRVQCARLEGITRKVRGRRSPVPRSMQISKGVDCLPNMIDFVHYLNVAGCETPKPVCIRLQWSISKLHEPLCVAPRFQLHGQVISQGEEDIVKVG